MLTVFVVEVWNTIGCDGEWVVHRVTTNAALVKKYTADDEYRVTEWEVQND